MRTLLSRGLSSHLVHDRIGAVPGIVALSDVLTSTPFSFFASYNRADAGWMYSMGNFAQMSLPLADSATLTIQRVNSTKTETITVRTDCVFRPMVTILCV